MSSARVDHWRLRLARGADVWMLRVGPTRAKLSRKVHLVTVDTLQHDFRVRPAAWVRVLLLIPSGSALSSFFALSPHRRFGSTHSPPRQPAIVNKPRASRQCGRSLQLFRKPTMGDPDCLPSWTWLAEAHRGTSATLDSCVVCRGGGEIGLAACVGEGSEN